MKCQGKCIPAFNDDEEDLGTVAVEFWLPVGLENLSSSSSSSETYM